MAAASPGGGRWCAWLRDLPTGVWPRLLLWLSLLGLCAEFEFGSAFVLASMLYGLWAYGLGRGTGRRPDRDQLSAYSVFNPHCRAIDGTLTLAQLEGEVRRGLL